MAEKKYFDALKDQMIRFFESLAETYPDIPEFVTFPLFIETIIPLSEIMNYIINKLLPLKEMVEKKDEKFFLEYNILFEKFDQNKKNKVDNFKEIWLKSSKENKEVLWGWFEAFLGIAEIYKEKIIIGDKKL